jgi:hypothetical protein
MSNLRRRATGLGPFIVLVWLVALAASAAADTRTSLLIVADGQIGPVHGSHKTVRIDARLRGIAARLKSEIDGGLIDEEGSRSPPQLQAFSDAVLAAVPDLFGYQSIAVVSEGFLPIELVRRDGVFLGDRISTSHEFRGSGQHYRPPPAREAALSRYVIEAVMPMPDGKARSDQDVIQVALGLDGQFPIELHLNPARDSLRRALSRDDMAILHIDTHGTENGRAIQSSYAGDIIAVQTIPRTVRTPLVLLFGCEGVADGRAFGAVLRARGAEAVISSFAKFESYGLTGDARREKRIYQELFAALGAGETVGGALLRVRQAAREEMVAGGAPRTLTRHFFVVVGNQQLRFKRELLTRGP